MSVGCVTEEKNKDKQEFINKIRSENPFSLLIFYGLQQL